MNGPAPIVAQVYDVIAQLGVLQNTRCEPAFDAGELAAIRDWIIRATGTAGTDERLNLTARDWITAAILAEREACAQVAEQACYRLSPTKTAYFAAEDAPKYIAALIRAGARGRPTA